MVDEHDEIGAYTLQLVNGAGGDAEVGQLLMNRVNDRLRRQASRMIANDKAGRDLGVTDLVHRAVVQLVLQRRQQFATGNHFRAALARTMQCVLIDHARRRIREDRRLRPTKDDPRAAAPPKPVEQVSDLDVIKLYQSDPQLTLDVAEAFRKLRQAHPDCYPVALSRVFGGGSAAEVAADLGLSERTAGRRWAVALAFLHDVLRDMGWGPAGG